MGTKGPYGFKGGWNTKASSWTLPPDCLTDSQNINIVWQDISKRNGNVILQTSPTIFSSGAAIHGLCDWLSTSGTRYLLVTAGTKIYQAGTLGSTYTDITGAATITSGQNNQHTFASLNNILAICGGVTPDTPLQWNGAGNVASLGGTPPVGNIVCVANNFMFIAGVVAAPSTVYWSNVNDPNTWPGTSSVNFRYSDGDSITALIEFNQNLVIFKRRSIGMLFTQTASVSGAVTLAPLTQIALGIGCPGKLCVDILPDGRIVFLGTDGHVYSLIGGTLLQDISNSSEGSNIQPTLNTMNFSRLPYAVLRHYPTRNQFWLSMSSASSTTNDTVFIYDYQLNVWVSSFTNINANVMEHSIDPRTTPDNPILMITGDYGGNIYEQDKGTTDATVSGGAIDAYATVSVLHGVDSKDWIPRSVTVPLEAQTLGQLTLGYGFNGLTDIQSTMTVSEAQGGGQLDTNFVLDTSTLGGPTTLRQVVPISSQGKVWTTQVQFRNSSASQPFQVHPIFLSDEVLV